MYYFILIATFFIPLLSFLTWKCTYWHRYGIEGPWGWPLVGNIKNYLLGRQHYGHVYQDIYNAYSHLSWIGIYRLFQEPAIIVRSQELLKEVMIRNFNHFQDNVLWINPKRDPIAQYNPFVARGDKWRQMRFEILPIFTPSKVKLSFPHIAATCNKLKLYIENKLDINCFEAKNLFSKYTLDVVVSAAYGLNGESLNNPTADFTQQVKDVFLPNPYSLLETTALLFSPFLGNLLNYAYIPRSLQNWLNVIVNKILETRLNKSSADETVTSSDFIQWLIENKKKLNETLERDPIVGHCSTFLLEGFETSSSLMAFALYEYAMNPEEQKKISKEIDQVMNNFNGELSYEALQKMPYVEASLYETLRLHAPMAALLKQCTKSFEFPAQHIDKGKPFHVPIGMAIVIPVRAIHYDPNVYPNPTLFKPSRFVDHLEKSVKQSCTFFGFGEGPRMCPGGRFGLAQSKAGLISILSKYTVHLADKMQQQPLETSNTTFLTAAKNGIWLSLKPRH
uniref:Cytochrome P450 n=1 Tax=Glossina brevipalpis TaxID=37001 RepID=A0A1A9X5E7_9MUSC